MHRQPDNDRCPLCETPRNLHRPDWLLILALVLMALGLAMTPSCATLKDVVWPAFVECTTSSQADVTSDVRRILLRDGDADELSAQSKLDLESLAKVWGAETIACLIEQLIDAWMGEGRASIPHAESQAARRGQLFLSMKNSHPTMRD